MSAGRKFWAIVCCGLCMFFPWAASGCSARGNFGVDSGIYLITKGSDSVFWRSVKSGADAAAAEYNVKVTFLEPSSEEAESEQNAYFEKAIAEKPAAVAISAISYEGSAAYIDRMAAAGIHVIMFDSGSKSDRAAAEIMIDNFESGRSAFFALRELTNEKIVAGIVSPYEQTGNGAERVNGFLSAAREDGNAEIVATENVVSNTADAALRVEEMLEKFPAINAMAAFNEWTTLGAGTAVESTGNQQKINVVGFDNNVTSIEHLEKGALDALVVQNPYAMGYYSVQNAYLYASGKLKKKNSVRVDTVVATRKNMYSEKVDRLLFPFA